MSAVNGGYYYPLGNRSKAICSWQLEVSQSCNWSLVRTWGGAGRGGAQGHFYNYTHFNIRLTSYLLAPLRVIRLYGAMKIQAHTHCHKDIWHSKFFSVPSYFFWQYRSHTVKSPRSYTKINTRVHLLMTNPCDQQNISNSF